MTTDPRQHDAAEDATDDDWAPLPAPNLDADDGRNRGPVRRQVRALPAPPIRPLPRDSAPVAPATADAERVLREMQQRLAAAPKSNDPVRRALSHAARKTAAESIVTAREAPTPAPTLDATPGVARVDYDADRDPREDEPWFRALPEREQQRLQQKWHAVRHRGDTERADRIVWLGRACWQGALVLGVVGAFLSLSLVPRLVVAGAVAGALGSVLGGSRKAHAAAGLVCGAVAMGQAALSYTGIPGLVLCTFGMALVGYDREMRRSGGFRARD